MAKLALDWETSKFNGIFFVTHLKLVINYQVHPMSFSFLLCPKTDKLFVAFLSIAPKLSHIQIYKSLECDLQVGRIALKY